MTFHPATLEKESAERQTQELLEALALFPEIHWIFTFPNADTESRAIIKHIKVFAEHNIGNASLFISLGQLKYLSLLNAAVVMAGNSSSGIIEAPSFELPVVNIGSRQEGRIRARNVIDVQDCNKDDIGHALKKALSEDFRASLKGLQNPYGDGAASARIVEIIKKASLDRIIKKHFYDIIPARA